MNQDLINRIKDANNIVDVIADKLSIHKAGVNYVAVCPFHADRAPSLTISPTKQIYKCFACGAGGDVIKFIQEYESVSFYDAVKYLADRANIEMPADIEETDDDKKKRLEREALFSKAREEQQLFVNQRFNKEYFDYLAHRNISQQTAEAYGLGFASDGFFFNRITYPFYDISGNVVGFTGRAVKWSKDSNYPKYKNSAESAIYNKSKTIFGLAQAKRDIMQNNNVFWCEGQNDVISLYQRGTKNVVCGSGTAFTEFYAKIISRFTAAVTLIYDADTAGRNAAIKAIHILLKEGLKINIITLPEGEDPDSWAQKNYDPEKDEDNSVSMKLIAMSKKWYDYLFGVFPYQEKNIEQNTENINSLLSFLDDIKDDVLRNQFIKLICSNYQIGYDSIKKQIKPKPKTDTWKDGYYGIEEAKEAYKIYGGDYELTFDEDYFITHTGEIPVVLWKGKAAKHAIQTLRSFVNSFVVSQKEAEHDSENILYELQKEKISIFVEDPQEGNIFYTDYYVQSLSSRLPNCNTSEQSIMISKALELIAHTDATMRTMKSTEWSKMLGLKETQYNKLLKPILDKMENKDTFDKQKYMYEGTEEINLYNLPEYVAKDKDMMRTYNAENYFPMLRKDGKKCAYVFKNEKGEGHSVISDFYMEPLLHIYSSDKQNNKRVLQLFHRNPKIPDKYVEWLSSTLTTLNNIEDQLINEGPYNFKGTAYQYKSLRSQLLYGFTLCEDIESYGQHKGGFWAFSNAIYHSVKNEATGLFENRIDYTNNLGVVSHDNKNYYSPACSEIFIENNNSQYEQDRYLIYKEIPEQDKISFEEWADLMNEVYKINDNGKWAIIFDIMSCFRDYIYDTRRCFTTLFFIGPTGSGKSQIAYSMRALFMSPDAPVFNLNSGTDAAFWLILARYRNVIAIMEEYNDTTISPIKFQGLKSAVLDGEGRMKVGNMNAKQIDSSKINAIPLLLGQEAPQQDDGSLANRSIICDVPVKANGTFSEHEIEIFEELKQHEKIGLSNVLIEILNIRPIVVSNFNNYFASEIKLLKNALSNVQNNDGLTRILNSVAMTTTMCRIIEEKTSLRLPFTYEEFFQLAVAKVMKQVESISTVNKLATYFNTISHLLTQGEIKKGREFKIDTPKDNRVSVRKDGSSYETKILEPGQRVLYINFAAIYPLYERTTGKDALSQMSLKNYIMANAAYIGFCKSTRFVYIEDTIEETNDADSGTSIKRQYKSITNNTCAYLFDYDKISELMNIDLVREDKDIQDDASADENGIQPPF